MGASRTDYLVMLACLAGCAAGHEPDDIVSWCDYIELEPEVDPCPMEPPGVDVSANLRPGERRVVRYHYNQRGQVVRTSMNRAEEWTQRWHYSDESKLDSVETAYRGRVYRREFSERDESGRTKAYLIDSDADGAIDQKTTITHTLTDAEHHVLLEIDGRNVVDALCWEFEPGPIDSTVDTRHTWVLDGSDRVLRRESDLDANGTLDELWTFHYAQGRLEGGVTERHTGRPDVVEEYTYDTKGRLTGARGVSDDGLEDQIEFVYDDAWPFEESCWYFVFHQAE